MVSHFWDAHKKCMKISPCLTLYLFLAPGIQKHTDSEYGGSVLSIMAKLLIDLSSIHLISFQDINANSVS